MISKNIKDKIVVFELNKDCYVTQICINVQRAGAKALIIIHNSNSINSIRLPRVGSFRDSIRIPIYTVRSGVEDSITTLLPTVVGIKVPVATRANQSIISSSNPLVTTEKAIDKTAQSTDEDTTINANLSNGIGFGKQGFSISPNPTRNQANVTFQFQNPTDITIEAQTASGQVIFHQILRGVTVGYIEIPKVDYPNGTYLVTLQYGKAVQTKKLVVRH